MIFFLGGGAKLAAILNFEPFRGKITIFNILIFVTLKNTYLDIDFVHLW